MLIYPLFRYLALVVLVANLTRAGEQVQYNHVRTFGTKEGIRPPKVMNSRFAGTITGSGDHPFGLTFPTAVTTDARHRVWIADRATASVHIFDVNGNRYQEIRKAGPVTLEQPAGLATDRQGRVYLTDSGSGYIFVFDKTGEYDRMLRPRKEERLFERPTAIAFSEDARRVYVADPGKHTVVALNQEGEAVGTLGAQGELPEPTSIAVVGDDVYVLDRGLQQVRVYSASGRFRRSVQWGDVQVLTAFAYSPSLRRFFVADPRWMIVDAFEESEPSRSLGAFGHLGSRIDQIERLEALYVDPEGLVYILDSHHGKVLVFSERAIP